MVPTKQREACQATINRLQHRLSAALRWQRDMIESPLPPFAISSGTTILVGLSGGLDSCVLLHRLSAISTLDGVRLRAIHVHHGLAMQADAWASQCQTFCASLGVEMTLVRVHVSLDHGQGLEAAARAARYRAYASAMHENEILALAHHRDDQAETVLLRLLRASGSDGLAAMRETRPFAGSQLWRPLLDVPRSRLLAYAQEHGLAWIEDPSNDDQRMDRNFIRQRILPALAERWPHAGASLARSAALLAEDADLLRAETDNRLAQVQSLDASTLSVTALLACEPAWRSRILRRWLSTLSLPPLPGAACAIIESDLLQARPDAEPEYRWAGTELRRWRDLLHAETSCIDFPENWQAHWSDADELRLPTGDVLRWLAATPLSAGDAAIPVGAASPATAIPAAAPAEVAAETALTFMVRARRGGERIRLPGREHSHALKKLLQELGVPPWERERLPLLFAADGELLAAGDLVISARLLEHCRVQNLRLSWQRA